ncbi:MULTISPECIES: nitroreductase/quinone reductase family protein [unclassified Rhodococcus (in: high G+C Gram-positive bacteria)]|uniref:nitroreductase/quinone reductase family protein n=1 Tax=unclassified Rhodococcus (in: high G+C Gram-positive bacteria) TaxID=192944 RepID=UPI00163B5538|nr:MULTISPECIES: nitroreductase/quinone reductase family protein [unclassified Rhodococcus (in: high G+C Gram-positive bacteria)]MBC2642705.1 nitroreductase family deazaflavin-dependent oxidoreductase [Rhodococcus sp. 3A]MBC2892553.1 nitroreductase family deazaflavin-dependent oxidoreductase [Rhodococcus sp. 4CII]
MPSDRSLKFMNALHRVVLRLTGGRVGKSFGKMPAVELTTVGRKTGQVHRVMLTVPVREGDTLVVVASRGGDDHHPAWYLNLQANPVVKLSLQGGPARSMRAHTATPEERARLWPQVTAAYKGYAGYQKKTDREIPLVLLDPES